MTESHDSHPLPRCYFDIIRGQSVYPMYATAKEAIPNYKCSLNFRTHAHGISYETDSRREMRWPLFSHQKNSVEPLPAQHEPRPQHVQLGHTEPGTDHLTDRRTGLQG